MSISEEVDQEWRMASIYKLNEYLTMQMSGARVCVKAVMEAVTLIEQPDSNFVKLHSFLVQCVEVMRRFCQICLQYENNFYVPVGKSTRELLDMYLKEVWLFLEKISSSYYKLVNRRKVYILIRILCKMRLKFKSYLVCVDYWKCNELLQ